MKTVIEQIKENISRIKETKARELETIQARISETVEQIEAAEKERYTAAAGMGVEAYAEASEKKKNLETALAMYRERQRQLLNLEFVSEEESDRVISSIMDYESEISAKYESDISKQLQILAAMTAEYKERIRDAEATLYDWTSNIHANYISSTTSRIDPLTGQRTNRSEKPVPVRIKPYVGCEAAVIIEDVIGGRLEKYCEK